MRADFLDPSPFAADANESGEEDAPAKGPRADLRPASPTPEDARALEPADALRMLHMLARLEPPLQQVSSPCLLTIITRTLACYPCQTHMLVDMLHQALVSSACQACTPVLKHQYPCVCTGLVGGCRRTAAAAVLSGIHEAGGGQEEAPGT